MSMTARRSVPCWSRLRARLCRLPVTAPMIATICQRHPDAAVIVAATFERGAKRNGRDRADEARPAPAADRRARSHGLAAGIRLQLACPGGGRYRPLQASDIGRYKRVIGDALRSRTKGRQTTEVAIAVASLNRMLELGRPEYLRLS